MGDDVEDHSTTITVDKEISLFDLCIKIIDMNYLAKIQGGKATWLLTVDNVWVGIIAEEWESPKMLLSAERKMTDILLQDKASEIFIHYFAQVDPFMSEKDIQRLGRGLQDRRIV